MHPKLPASSEKVPSGQAKQFAWPIKFWCSPGRQRAHAVDPTADVAVPAPHSLQVLEPDEFANLPASQGMHTACALRLDVPLAHGRHCHEVASFAKEPPSHAVQLVAPLLLSVANPNGQSMHRSESGIGPYRPSSHFTPDNHINKVFIVIVWGR